MVVSFSAYGIALKVGRNHEEPVYLAFAQQFHGVVVCLRRVDHVDKFVGGEIACGAT